jgi:pimeloyl-ACP methyl ester carboxylesterase
MDPRAHLACNEAYLTDPSLADVLPTMTMPCLVYIGEYDDEIAQVKEYVQHMPNAALFVIPGRRHSDTSLAVDVLVPRVLEFLATVQ